MSISNSTRTIDSGRFESNAFSDFAPLLTLFGDEVTKQFLATSMSLADDVLLGIAPIGVMTIIVSAIRIGGHRFMKSLIGRVRDSPDDEERELLSSTSGNVREVWNGRRVVRQTGPCVTKAFVFDSTAIKNPPDGVSRFNDPSCLWPLDQKYVGYIPLFQPPTDEVRARGISIGRKRARWFFPVHNTMSPNLTTNIDGAVPSRLTVMCYACLAFLVQLTVMVINAMVVYRWHWLRAGKLFAPHGYLSWAVGTVSIALGTSMCGWIIESSCWKTGVVPVPPARTPAHDHKKLQLIFLQKRILEFNTPAYKFSPTRPGEQLKLSRRRFPPIDMGLDSEAPGQQRRREIITGIGVVITLGGFITQNVGTRELHWSAGIFQLVATLVATALRGWLRRRVGDPPTTDNDSDICELTKEFEASDLATRLTGNNLSLVTSLTRNHWHDSAATKYTGHLPPRESYESVNSILTTQAVLADWAADQDMVLQTATSCTNAMCDIANYNRIPLNSITNIFQVILSERQLPKLSYTFPSFCTTGRSSIGIPYTHIKQDLVRFCKAIISLTLYIHFTALSRQSDRDRTAVYRVLGRCFSVDVEAYTLLLDAWTGCRTLQWYNINEIDHSFNSGSFRKVVTFGLPFSASPEICSRHNNPAHAPDEGVEYSLSIRY